MYVCMYVCMYECNLCTHACMHVCMYVYMHANLHACMYLYMVCMCACMYECIHSLKLNRTQQTSQVSVLLTHPFQVLRKFPALSFLNYAYICTWIKGSLRETVLPSIITWPERGKLNTQAKEFYWIVYNFKKLYVENLFTCQYSTCLWRDH